MRGQIDRGRMGRHNDAHERAAFVQALVWAVEEHPVASTFCTGKVLISRQVQARRELGMIEEAVVFAASYL